jgi:CheY-like chemotaxis protein
MRLDKIDSAGQHLLSVVNDVLDLSKIEAGRVQIESTTFHLSAVLDAVQSMIADSARAKGLAVKVGGDAVPLWLRGDPTRLRQALLNFAGNAVKFTERGSVTLAATLLQDRGDELLVRFSVTDTGIGIAAENLPRLFQSFEQADASITRKFGGTGLGLAITRRLAELMHGECGVDSEAGLGSSFWFTALFQRGHSVSPVAAPESPTMLEEELRRNHRGARVLLAEDNEVNREIAVSMLDGVGLAVDVAVDGQQAVTMAGSRRYALVLMDMQMPRMGGLEATRVIRSLEGWESRPILALTASAFAEDRLACKAAGMNDLIAKPMDVKVLYSALLKWLDGPGARAA